MVCFSLCIRSFSEQIVWIHRLQIAMGHNYSLNNLIFSSFRNAKTFNVYFILSFHKTKPKLGAMWTYIGSIQLSRNNGSSIWQMGLLFVVSASIYVSIFRWVHNHFCCCCFKSRISRSDSFLFEGPQHKTSWKEDIFNVYFGSCVCLVATRNLFFSFYYLTSVTWISMALLLSSKGRQRFFFCITKQHNQSQSKQILCIIWNKPNQRVSIR